MKTDIARTNLKTTPTDIVCALYGASSVTLSGFEKKPWPPVWTRPGLVYVSAPIASDAVVAEVLGAKRKIKWIERAAWLALIVGSMALQQILTMLSAPKEANINVQSWQITRVTNNGLIAKSGEQSYQITVGSRLPNGDRLLAVIPERNAYATQHSTVILQGQTP